MDEFIKKLVCVVKFVIGNMDAKKSVSVVWRYILNALEYGFYFFLS